MYKPNLTRASCMVKGAISRWLDGGWSLKVKRERERSDITSLNLQLYQEGGRG